MPGDEAGAGDDEWEGLGHADATAKGSDPDFFLIGSSFFYRIRIWCLIKLGSVKGHIRIKNLAQRYRTFYFFLPMNSEGKESDQVK